MLHEELSRLMALPYPFDEANEKFRFCYLILNGTKLIYYKCVYEDKLVYKEVKPDGSVDEFKSISENKVKSLDIFLPDTGIYQLKPSQTFALYKLPTRHWRKSAHEYVYHIDTMTTFFTGMSAYMAAIFYRNLTPKEFWKDEKNTVYYMGKRIGVIHKETGKYVGADLFAQEVSELLVAGAI